MSNRNNVIDSDLEYSKSSKNISFAFFLNIILMVIIAIGAIFTNSMTILANLLDGLSDTFVLGFSWFFQRFSEKKEDEKFTYGYKRFSLLGAIITSTLIIFSSIFVLIESIDRLFFPSPLSSGPMILIAIFAIILKTASVLKLKASKTFNEQVVSMHLIADLLSWITLLFVGIILLFYNIPHLDVFLAIAIIIWLLYNLSKTLISTFKILLLGAPEEINQSKLKSEILAIEEVDEILKFYLWSIDNQKNILTVEIRLTDDLKVSDTEKIKKSLYKLCLSFGIKEINIEFKKSK